jgi:TIR domain
MLISEDHLNLFETKSVHLLSEQVRYLGSFLNKNEDHITVFLSHKHDEKEILKKVIELLKNNGANIYIDWQDDKMPDSTNGETANLIKNQIRTNQKFIFVASNGAINSKWCNWELGYADSLKYDKNIALMPITKNDGSWTGNEYLQIYPVIKSEYRHLKGFYYVEFNGEKIDLKKWLNL